MVNKRRKMKKITGLVYGLLVLLLYGCGTTNLGVWDENIPNEELCTLEIRNSLSIVAFDTKPVNYTNPQALLEEARMKWLQENKDKYIMGFYHGK
jgi:hypothetical protein